MRRTPFLVISALLAALPVAAWGQTLDTGEGLRGTMGDSDDTTGGPAGLVASTIQAPVAILPPTDTGDDLAPPRTRPRADDDPFAALGIRVGSFIYYPAVEITGGYTTNAANAAGGVSSGTITVAPELVAKSQWDRHELTVTLRGSYEDFTNGASDPKPEASLNTAGKIDLADGWSIDLASGYHYGTQSLSDPDFPAGVDSPPGVHELTGDATLNGRYGRMTFALGASADRTVYEDGTSGGATVDQHDRTNTLYAATLRLGFEMTAKTAPFIEGEVSRRVYDQAIDNNGIERSSSGVALRTGIAYTAEPQLTGEWAIGLRQETLDDATLPTITTPTLDASLVWSPTALTRISLDTTTSISPSTDPSSSGSVIHDVTLDAAYDYRRNVTLDVSGAFKHERFDGSGLVERTYTIGAGATWKLNRTVQLISRYEHEWLASDAPASDYTSDSVTVGLRVQR